MSKISKTTENINLPLDKCKECPLYDPKTHNPYNYWGNSNNPDVFIMGEAPGTMEQQTGKAFQGRAGKFLQKELKNIGIDNVFVSNSVLCRPTEKDKYGKIKDRKPSAVETKCCFNNIEAQLEAVNPKIYVPLGATAIKRLGVRGTITKVRGSKIENEYGTIIPAFHPAYVLRAPQNKSMFLTDLQYIKDNLEGKETKQGTYKIIRTVKEAQWLFTRLNEVEAFSFDIETTGLSFFKNSILGIGFSWEEGTGVYLPLRVKMSEISDKGDPEGLGEYWYVKEGQTTWEWIREALKSVFLNSTKKIAHNGKFDVKFINYHYQIQVKNFYADTMLLHYVLDENMKHGLKELADIYYPDLRGYAQDLNANITQTKKEGKQFGEVPLEILGTYCAQDCDTTFRLFHSLSKQLIPGTEKLFYHFYMPLSKVYIQAETQGVKVDVNYIKQKMEKFDNRITQLEKEIHKIAGEEFNINSPKQLQVILFEKLKYKSVEKTATGQDSTAEGALKKIKDPKGIIEKILEIRGKRKMVSTYFKSILEKIDSDDRIHTSFLLHGTVTGRISSKGPNLTNIPRDPEIKGLFIPGEDYHFVEFDYSQAELRTVAWYAQEPIMMQEYKDKVDLHTATASVMFQKEKEEVSKRERKIAKAVAFGTLYGGGKNKLAESVNARLEEGEHHITPTEAQQYIRKFFQKYRNIDKWIKTIHRYAHTNKQVVNCFGRVRRLPTIDSSEEGMVREAERQACNSLIQGTASDIAQLSLIKIHKYLLKNNMKSRFLFSVHDALIFEIHKDEYEELRPIIIKLMESPPKPFDMEIKADEDFYKNRWGVD